jgi:protein-disulfide isomerase
VLRRAVDPRLRIWFNDGTRGWQVAGDDVLLAPALGTSGTAATGTANNAQMEAVLRELKELRAKVEKQQAVPAPQVPAEPKIVTVSLGSSPSLGKADAPLVLVEFTDFQCPFCKRFHETTMPELVKNYVETGKLRIVSRNLALSFHDKAEPAAQAALCAHQQKKFWAMREKLFGINTALTGTNILKAAEEVQMNMAAFRACVDGKSFAQQVAKDGEAATAAGISGTPTFVLGRQTGENVTGVLLVGARPYAAFEAEIKKMLGK